MKRETDDAYNDHTEVQVEHDYVKQVLNVRIFDGSAWVNMPGVPFPNKASPSEAAHALELVATYLRQGTKTEFIPAELKNFQSDIWVHLHAALTSSAILCAHLNMLFNDDDPEWGTCLMFRTYPGKGASLATCFRVKKKEYIAMIQAAD